MAGGRPAGRGGGDVGAVDASARPPTTTARRRSCPPPFADIAADARARWPITPAGRALYAHDWTSGAFLGILAPAAHVFLLTLIPALAFGEQSAAATGGEVTGASVLTSTAIFGVAQALFGGQPLLIVGVAEPLVLVYTYLAAFARRVAIPFLPFAAWSCVWAAAFLAVMAAAGAGRCVSRFTRFSADLFGALVGGALFFQQAVAIVVRQFRGDVDGGGGGDAPAAQAWRLANGAWSLFVAVCMTVTTLATRRARSWTVGPPGLRAVLADVAAPIMVLAWSGLAYAPRSAAPPPPPGLLPRPLDLPAPWAPGPRSAWSVAGRMAGLGGRWAGAAAVPGLVIAVLFYFDHTIVQRVALPEAGGGGGDGGGGGGEGGGGGGGGGGAPPPADQPPPRPRHKPATYALDLAWLALATAAAGLAGLPPVNAVLPQAPMHTHALAVAAREREGRRAGGGGVDAKAADPHDRRRPLETRVAALLQSLAVGAAAAATPLFARIPQPVIAAYFAYMAVESLETNQLASRVRYLLAHPSSRPALRRAPGAPACLTTAPHAALVRFTLLQAAVLLTLYAWTWIPIGGVFFPILLMALVPVRASVLPRFFSPAALRDLDASEFEELAPGPPPIPAAPSFTGLEAVRVLSPAEAAARRAREEEEEEEMEGRRDGGGGV